MWREISKKRLKLIDSVLLWVVVFISSVMSNSATPWTAARQAFLSSTISRSLFKLLSIELVMPSNHFTLCHLLLLLPAIFPSLGSFPMSQLFTSGGQSIGASASASVLQRNDWLDLLVVHQTLKSLLQHHSLKESIFSDQPFLLPSS